MNFEEKIHQLLSIYENHIDVKKIQAARDLNHRAICFQEVDHIPMSIRVKPDPVSWPSADCEQMMRNPAAMLYNELLFSFGSIMTSMEIGDDFLYQIRGNYGVGITASTFGANIRVVNNMPWVDPFSDKQELYRIASMGVPPINSGFAAKLTETYEYFNEVLRQYPICYQTIAITQPDLQGPFDNADLLLGADIFYEIYDDEEMLLQMLEVLRDTYVALAKNIEGLLTGQVGGNSQIVHGSLFPGHCIIKDDTGTVNLSPELYERFSAHYNKQVFRALKGGTLHHCGRGQKWHYDLFRSPWLNGLNYGQPQFHDLQEKIDCATPDHVALIGWGNDLSADCLNSFYQRMPSTGMSISISARSIEEAKRIYVNHLELSRRAEKNTSRFNKSKI